MPAIRPPAVRFLRERTCIVAAFVLYWFLDEAPALSGAVLGRTNRKTTNIACRRGCFKAARPLRREVLPDLRARHFLIF